jgi:acetyl-CoA carboxylase carboxyltransferase component
VGTAAGREVVVVANDATVKAGSWWPETIKKMLRAQEIAMRCRVPIIYLVDSAGVFLPLQDEVFPDEDDFGRIFRNNAVISAMGLGQIAAIMGNCVAGGGYLPVLCDKLLMTDEQAQEVTIDHDPVESLNWPAMVMPFQVSDASLLEDLEVGERVNVTVSDRGDGQFVIHEVDNGWN